MQRFPWSLRLKLIAQINLSRLRLKQKISQHDKPILYLCTVCDKRFTTKDNLNRHKEMHALEKLCSTTQHHIFSAVGRRRGHRSMLALSDGGCSWSWYSKCVCCNMSSEDNALLSRWVASLNAVVNIASCQSMHIPHATFVNVGLFRFPVFGSSVEVFSNSYHYFITLVEFASCI